MTVGENFLQVQKDIPQHVTLVAVSKTKPVSDILSAYNAGAREFGENKVQELVKKYEELPKDINWHLIGHLQRNKVKYIVGKVKLIHSLDSIRLLEEIEKQYEKENCIAETLVQVNIGREESKTGVLIEDFYDLLNAIGNCSHVKVKGLMATIPKGDEKSCAFYFGEMKKLFEEVKSKELNNVSMEILSMGMTNDYETAIKEGSTMVRIGKKIFGERNYNI